MTRTRRLPAPTSRLTKGTKVEINHKHAGCAGSTGRITVSEFIRGRCYYTVRMTGGKGRGLALRFTARELDLV